MPSRGWFAGLKERRLAIAELPVGTVVPTTGPAPPGGFQFPVKAIFITTDPTNPAILFGYGTWTEVGAGRVLIGLDSGDPDFDSPGDAGGAKTSTPTGTVSAPTFTGSALAPHQHGPGTITPSAHSGAAVSAHSGAGVADHASHTHAYTDVVNHTHVVNVTDPGHAHAQRRNASTTGANTGWTTAFDTSSSNPVEDVNTGTGIKSTGISASSNNPAGGVASGTTQGPSATLSHGVTQPSDHVVTQPADHTMSGASESVSGGTPAGSVSSPSFSGSPQSIVQPYLVVYFWQRTA